MTLADLTVDIIPIVGSIAGKRRNRADNLLQQGTNLRAVIDILAGQLGGDDLSSVGVHAEMELSPGPTCPCGMLLDDPLTGTAARGAGLGPPRRNRCFREPDGQAPALAQGDVIGGPIRHSVPLLRDE